MRLNRKLGCFIGAIALSTGAALVCAPTAASAATCTSGHNYGNAYGRCVGTSKLYTVFALCEENSGAQYWAQGNTTRNGNTSFAYCHEYAYAVDDWINVAE